MQQLVSQVFNVEDLTAETTLATLTLTGDADLFVEIEITLQMTGANLDTYVYIDGIKCVSFPIAWTYMVQSGVTNYDTYRIRTRVGPVMDGAVVTVRVASSEILNVEGTVRIWDMSVMSQLNEAMPDDRTANSPLDDLRRCRAFLANKTIQTLDTGVIVVKDNDNATTLFTLTPSESGGDLTVTPD